MQFPYFKRIKYGYDAAVMGGKYFLLVPSSDMPYAYRQFLVTRSAGRCREEFRNDRFSITNQDLGA